MIKFILKTLTLLTIILTIQSCQSQPTEGIKEYKYSNGKTQFIYTYQKGVLNGTYKAYYETGTLWAEGNYVNGELNGQFKTYTLEGKLATEEEYNDGTLTYQKIYWQPIPYNDKNFLFSSAQGFVTIKDGKNITLDSKTPDNIIEEKMNLETGSIELYIWSGGQKKLYKTLSK